MELVPDESAPGLVQAGLRIGDPAQPVGGHGAALGGIRQLLVQPVEALHCGLRSVTAGPVDIHRQFLVPDRQFRVGAERQEILEQLVRSGTDDLDASFAAGPLFVDGSLHRGDRTDGGGAARVAGPVIMEGNVGRVEGGVLGEFGGNGQVLPVETGGIGPRIGGHHNLIAVQRAPEAEFEGNLTVDAGQVHSPPLQFLGGEADQAAVGGDGGQLEPEAEAVGQEDVRADGAEFLLVEMLSEQDVPGERFGGGNIGVRGFPAAAGDVPAPVGDEPAQAGKGLGMVLLHPVVFDAGLAIEHIVGIPVDEHQITEQRLRDIVRDGPLHVPVPLGVQVRVGGQVGLGRGAVGLGLGGGNQRGQEQEGESGFE